MSEQVTRLPHPLLGCVQTIAAALDDAASFDPDWLPPGAKGELLVDLARQSERLAALRLRVLAGADDVAAESGARSAPAWLAHQTRVPAGRLRWESDLAQALRERYQATGGAFAAGDLSIGHAAAVADSLDALPDHVTAPVRAEAEQALLAYCDRFTPKQVRRLGRRILEVVAPEVAEEEDRKALEAQERRALRETTLSLTPLGDGRTRIAGIIPDLAAAVLRTALDAYLNPRRHDPSTAGRGTAGTAGAGTPGGGSAGGAAAGAPAPGAPAPGAPAPANPFVRTDPATGDRLGAAQQRGLALCALIEHLPVDGLPDHGGTPVSLILTIDHEKLQQALGTATLSTGGDLSAGQARRLACHHQILPAVLDGDSVPLDLGRSSRLFSHHQARAHAITHPTCQAEGCDIAWGWCERHHRLPWSHLGRTDLAELVFLCSYHHHRAHDPGYRHTWGPGDTLTFHRRT